MKEFVEKVLEFNLIAGTEQKFDPRKLALYIGLILEETKEMFEAINHEDWNETVVYFQTLSDMFKSGEYDDYIQSETFDRLGALDSAVDIAVVSIGAGIATGSDIIGACHAVADNNLEKFPLIDGVRTVIKDEHGKVKKPDGYQSVQLKQYLIQTTSDVN